MDKEFYWRKALFSGLIIFLILLSGKDSKGEGLISIVEEDIKNAIHQVYNVPKESILVTTLTKGNFPLQGRLVTSAKAFNLMTQEVYTIGLDEQKQVIDLTILENTEIELHRMRYGNLEPDLYDQLYQMQDTDTIDVIIWLKGDDASPILTPSKAEVETKLWEKLQEEYRIAREVRQQRLSKITMPFVEFLKKEYNTGQAASDVPVISAKLSKQAIRIIANRLEIDKIYLPRGIKSVLNQSSYAIRAPYPWSSGIKGSGKVGIVDWEPVATWNPNLSVTVVGWNWYGCYGTDSYHATYVAGVIDSSDYNATGHLGIAREASIVSAPHCGKTGTELEILSAATNDIINAEAHVINNSWGTYPIPSTSEDFASRYHDTVAKTDRITFVDAAGNCLDGNCKVGSPAMGYNVIAVGAFDDNNSGSNWTDDIMASWSSYIDPSSTYMDREKPELVAPGVKIETTKDTWPWITDPPGVDGTSFAAPHVSGATNLLMQRKPTLQTWPEAVKATLMASAIHNIEGSSRLSEYDGVGAISLDKADYVARENSANQWDVYTLTPSSFDSNGNFYVYFAAQQGQRIRAVISWAVDPNYSGYPNRPGVDIDLYVFRPNYPYSPYVYSTSYDNNYEIVDFIAPAWGSYKLVIKKRMFNDASTTLGVAWYNGTSN